MRVFAYVPICCSPFVLDGIEAKLVRIGFTNGSTPLPKMFKGLNAPDTILMDVKVRDGRESFNRLVSILRGHEDWGSGGRRRFRLFADFTDTIAGYNWKRVHDLTLEELKQKFGEIGRVLAGETLPEDPADMIIHDMIFGGIEEEGEPGASVVMRTMSSAEADAILEGEKELGASVVMRTMSSAEAAAILCGVPGSLEAVLRDN